ncbi:MAG: hypothetical protein QOI74_167 [Micromonosporaceae bacterium]|jgi:hypothetical protein|nr:hypothetical protein [Micromonosporaceae bacterium]MDT5036611.1 hypothetical protein [Micromonosporaceae bacterium]
MPEPRSTPLPEPVPERTSEVPERTSEPVRSGGTVHWIGTGLSTGSGLGLLCDLAPQVRVWGRTVARAAAKLERLGLAGRAEPAAFVPSSLAAELRPGDIVVSMLPASEHGALLRLCVPRGAHFACSSYVSDDLLAQSAAAASAGLVVLAEAGLDPGIDHILARKLVTQGLAVIGEATAASASFTSYCGGLPAEPNEFRYRFSWAPRGVLTALRSPATFIEDAAERTVDRPWEATRPHTVGDERFEAYPNRNSLPFVAQYGIPPAWSLQTFVRGTLRLDGWRRAWEPVFAELRSADPDRIAALADRLAARYPTTGADRDRVVLAVALRLRGRDGTAWSGGYSLDLVGDERESAMARCVSTPLAFGVTEILAGRMRPGLHRAAESAAEADRWLDFLERHGIRCTPSAAAPG